MNLKEIIAKVKFYLTDPSVKVCKNRDHDHIMRVDETCDL